MTTSDQVTSSCCNTNSADPVDASQGRENLLTGTNDDTTSCPVMVGSPVSKAAAVSRGLFRDYEDQRYYFCCAGCGPTFDSDPAKYAANMI
ncbi:YHS domain-containing protein [Leucobacter coleopterorum]|uniref:YHS domain-containing protein n=1 Tax=Leucobacter coleopterorum TaxID=2714933 RepID=A0ABX6K0E6_9MICO|nr:YHS domain-containing protein [Leucobacter coleopterorum]QIM18679.1 YHS domain-containing protein [Leucobacter coleopterorum]